MITIGVYDNGFMGYVKSFDEETGELLITSNIEEAKSDFSSFDDACGTIDSF